MTSTDEQVAIAIGLLQARHDKPNGSGKSYPYRLVPFDELRPGTKSSYLVEGVIPRAGLAAAWGPPKCGKSFWTFDLTLHIALRWSYRGRRVNGGPVCYLAFEGAEGFKARAEAFRRSHKIEGKVPFFLLASNAKLVRDHRALIESIDGQMDAPPMVVVLDTLNRSIDGSESKDADMGAYLAAAETIVQEFDCVVIVVHHCGVDGSRPRGHTSLTGAVDVQIAVSRDAANMIVAEVEAMKDGAEGARFMSALKVIEVGTDDDGEPITSCVIEPVEGEAKPQKAKAKLSDNNKLAIDALNKAVTAEGQRPPAKIYSQQGGQIRVVRLEHWRRYFCAMKGGEADSADRIFRRAPERLQVLNIVGVWEDFAWLADRADRGGQPPDNRGFVREDLGSDRTVSPLKGETVVRPSLSESAVPAFRVIGSTPQGTVCVQCNSADGEVKKIASTKPDAKPEPLHKECARFWFGGDDDV